MALAIGTRLTVWYSGVLLFILIVFGAGTYVSIRSSIQTSVDRDLKDRLTRVESFMKREIPRFQKDRLWHEFEESVQLQPGGEMMQISDGTGRWIFQSESIRGLQLAAPGSNLEPALATLVLRGIPVRVRTAAVRVDAETYEVQLATTLSGPYESLNRFYVVMLALVPAFMLVGAGVGLWMSKRALAPVARIIEDSRNISFGNLSRRLMVPKTGDELQRLSETLNDMIQRLESAFFRIAQFTADASHELRTPVAFLRTTAEVALLQERDIEAYRSALAAMLCEAERMTKLIEELLTLARADAGSSQLDLAPLDVRNPLAQASSQAIPLAQRKQIQFSAEIPDRRVHVVGDFAALQRLFLILMDNAIKYTPSGGSVEVGLSTSGTGTIVAVKDNGIGISSEELHRIFDRFFRSEKARQCDSDGSGLGLSIGRWIADAHHAEIEVDSTINRGSEFRIRFATSI